MLNDVQVLLAAMAAEPDNDTPRLVLADCLDDADEPSHLTAAIRALLRNEEVTALFGDPALLQAARAEIADDQLIALVRWPTTRMERGVNNFLPFLPAEANFDDVGGVAFIIAGNVAPIPRPVLIVTDIPASVVVPSWFAEVSKGPCTVSLRTARRIVMEISIGRNGVYRSMGPTIIPSDGRCELWASDPSGCKIDATVNLLHLNSREG